ncbi:HAMP domain-containing sensor histidine kinase [Proteiniclasticum sp. QWL-01]|uniref:sensor histidine kinase n=1 Tax=Proteiniclasticum sp. QWL-01 TaxID=3036945 RepID=UPI00240FC0BF|nr:HAMP domain-containing sensor histidine kinase [Proteiniclasticum sp. QWL-01]WFF71691.1 HAMP domain-containing sensor histidine kinase [Proteiniclasticum sp. QWL-01]
MKQDSFKREQPAQGKSLTGLRQTAEQIGSKAREWLARYLDLFQELYVEEFLIWFAAEFLFFLIAMEVIRGTLAMLLMVVLLGAWLLPISKYARDLSHRSLLMLIPGTAIPAYGIWLFGVILIQSATHTIASSFFYLLIATMSYGLTTAFISGRRENWIMRQTLAGNPLTDRSPRSATRKAMLEAVKTKDLVEQEVANRLKAERLRTELITNVSHDIRTPLTSILNFSQLLGQEELGEVGRDYLQVVEKSARRMKVMVDDLFTATRTASGNLQLTIETVDLTEVLMQTYAPLHADFMEKGMELVCSWGDTVVPVRADGTQLSRVIQNLLVNALKYSVRDTRVYVRLTRTQDSCIMTVINISRNKLDQSPEELMEQFVRGDQSRHTEGSGLGLYIATNLARAMAGQLELAIEGDVFEARLQLPPAQSASIGPEDPTADRPN